EVMSTLADFRPGDEALQFSCTVKPSLGFTVAKVSPTTEMSVEPLRTTFDTSMGAEPKLLHTIVRVSAAATSCVPKSSGDGLQRRTRAQPPEKLPWSAMRAVSAPS